MPCTVKNESFKKVIMKNVKNNKWPDDANQTWTGQLFPVLCIFFEVKDI